MDAARPHLEQNLGSKLFHNPLVPSGLGVRETLPCCVGMIWSLQQREFVSIMPSGDHEVTQCAMLVHLYPFLPAVKINSVTFL